MSTWHLVDQGTPFDSLKLSNMATRDQQYKFPQGSTENFFVANLKLNLQVRFSNVPIVIL